MATAVPPPGLAPDGLESIPLCAIRVLSLHAWPRTYAVVVGGATYGAGSGRALSEPIPPCRRFLMWWFEFVLAPKALVLVLAPKALVFSSPGAEGPKQFMCPSVCVSLSPSPVVSLRKMRLGRPQGQKFSNGAFGGRFQRGPSAPAHPHILGPRQVLLPGGPKYN